MERYCPRCNTQNEPEDRYCGNCGYNLQAKEGIMGGTQVEMKLTDVHFNLGMVYFKKGDFPEAVNMFEKVLANNPAHPAALEMLEKLRNQPVK